jgi:hypothetical protein
MESITARVFNSVFNGNPAGISNSAGKRFSGEMWIRFFPFLTFRATRDEERSWAWKFIERRSERHDFLRK